jgi:hypothetical protein
MSACLCSLEPDLNFVAIRIGEVSVGKGGSELATTEQAASGAFDLGDGTVDVVGVHEPKAEMRNTATETGRGGVLGEGEDVVPTGRLSVDEPISAPILTQTEDLLVEPQRASQIAHREIDVRKAVGSEPRIPPGDTSLGWTPAPKTLGQTHFGRLLRCAGVIQGGQHPLQCDETVAVSQQSVDFTAVNRAIGLQISI